MPTSPIQTRRGFLTAGLAAGALLALPKSVYHAALLADEKPSEKIRIGVIGTGGQGKSNMKAILQNVVAVCDVDRDHLAQATKIAGDAKLKVEAYADYRKLLDDKTTDAVLIATPDHWHALITIGACEAGKDVYCEKPLTLVIAEGRAMVNAARKHKRIVQTGSQQRSDAKFRQACELVRSGAVGKIHTVKVGLPGPNFKAPGVPDGKAPEALDYDLWLGPAPERAYNEKRVHYLFRFFWDYSGGQQTNFGAHHLDIAQWGLGTDGTGPTKIEGKATFNKDKWFETPETAHVTYSYDGGVKVYCSLGGGKDAYAGGTTFIGEKGELFVTRGKIELKLDGEKIEPGKFPTPTVKLTESGNHHKNWLECIKTRKAPICDVEIGHRSATVCHLGNIALRTGKAIVWDPAKEEIVGDAEAAKMVTKVYRKPWNLG
jgi:predicted dehydrogenase